MPRAAEYSAIGTAIESVMMREPMVRIRVLMPTRSTSESTGMPVRMEVPKFPRSMPASQDRYCRYQDFDAPRDSRRLVRASAEDIWPSSSTLNGSPGDENRMMKTTKLTPRSRSPVIISSLDSTRAMGRMAESFMAPYPRSYSALRIPKSKLPLVLLLHEPLVRVGEKLVGMDGDAPHFLVVRRIVGERPEKRIRVLLGQDRVQLAVDGPPLLVIERELALVDQAVHFGVGVAAEVVLP